MDLMGAWHFSFMSLALGKTLKALLKGCAGLTSASDVGADTSTLGGIQNAKNMSLVESQTVDFITTQFVHKGAILFIMEQRDRMFTMIRPPVAKFVFGYLDSRFLVRR
eukprot:g13929.t1 g13929   contig9:760287-760761(+)